jgi:hypothetical protein
MTREKDDESLEGKLATDTSRRLEQNPLTKEEDPKYQLSSRMGAALKAIVITPYNVPAHYGDITGITAVVAGAVGWAFAHFNGFDSPPFTWVWPEHEIVSHRTHSLENPEQAQSMGEYLGVLTGAVPVFALSGFAVLARAAYNGVNAFLNPSSDNK